MWSQEPPAELTASSTFDWQSGTLQIDLATPVIREGANAPAAIHRAEREIDRRFPSEVFTSLLPLRLDSERIVEDVVRERPSLAADIAGLATLAQRGLPRPSPALDQVSNRFRVPIFPHFVELFIQHQFPFRMEELVSWVPSREFSGVVIYAAEPVPLHGTRETVRIRPAILPEIYDTNLRPVLEQDMMDPAAIRRWGVVAYTDQLSEDEWRARIGTTPLRVMARRAYGIQPTDLVISVEDADRLLVNEHNRELLRQGRILVILGQGQTITTD